MLFKDFIKIESENASGVARKLKNGSNKPIDITSARPDTKVKNTIKANCRFLLKFKSCQKTKKILISSG